MAREKQGGRYGKDPYWDEETRTWVYPYQGSLEEAQQNYLTNTDPALANALHASYLIRLGRRIQEEKDALHRSE